MKAVHRIRSGRMSRENRKSRSEPKQFIHAALTKQHRLGYLSRYALCGDGSVHPEHLTSKAEDVTCPECVAELVRLLGDEQSVPEELANDLSFRTELNDPCFLTFPCT